MDSALRPRDIQMRIRHGEAPESVAQLARVTVDQLMPYAGPVLAERAHMAERAQRSSVRRRSPGSSAGRTLGEAVDATLRRAGGPADGVEWDAWRRDDGRWTLAASVTGDHRTADARFVYDAPGNYVTLDNDDAAWLVGDVAEPPEQTPVTVPGRRLAAVLTPPQPADTAQLSLDGELGSDALDLVRDEPAPPAAADPAPAPAEAVDAHPAGPAVRRSAPAARRRGRASVPSWDEIMFGQPD